MSYNCKGDLYKREIVKILQDKGFHVKSVNALNKICLLYTSPSPRDTR